jgi:hypothetical protein
LQDAQEKRENPWKIAEPDSRGPAKDGDPQDGLSALAKVGMQSIEPICPRKRPQKER